MKNLGVLLAKYSDVHYFHVVLAYCSTFVFLQTFSIPGSIFLSVIGGRIFGLIPGILMVCTLSTLGASFCYLLAYFTGRRLVKKLFKEKLDFFGTQVARHRKSLLNYILFLRITPIIPNWFINISSPIFDIPLHLFAIGTFIGKKKKKKTF